MSNIENLVITAIGEDQTGIVNALSEIITSHKANILDSRMTVLGGEFAIILLVSGTALDKLAEDLTAAQPALGLAINCKETAGKKAANTIPYTVEIFTMDEPGIVHKVALFFSKADTNIEDMHTTHQKAVHTGTDLFIIQMVVGVPHTTSANTLREDFLDFCDDEKLDGTMEIAV